MPYKKTKDGSLVNEITLGDGYPLSNDLQPLKVGGEASPIEMSTSLPDGSDSGKVKVRGDLEVTGGLNFKNDVEVDLSFDDLSLSGDLSVAGDITANELTLDGTDAGITITNTGDVELHFEQGTGHAANITSNNAIYMLAGSSKKLHFGANNTNSQMALDDGKLGIGTTSPSTELEVDGTGTFKNVDILDTTDGNNPRLRVGRENTQHIEINVVDLDNTIKAEQDIDGNGDHNFILDREFGGTGANNFKIQKGGSDQLVIDTSGNVGIGTASPAEKLHVVGNLKVVGNISSVSGGASIGDSAADVFRTTGHTYLATVDNNVGIGTTSPTTKLDVEGTVSYKHTAFTTAGPTDNVDVSDTTVLEVDTSSNNVTIGGFTGGVQGQILYVVKTDTANFIQLEHNEGGGSQDIFLTSGSDDRVVGYGGYTLYCNGTSWFALSNPTGAADAG